MAHDPESLQAEEELPLPTLPGLVRVLGTPLPDGSHEEVRFSNDGRIVLASLYQGMSRAYDVRTGHLLLDTSSYQVIERITENPSRSKWEVARFLFHVVSRGFGLFGGLAPRLTREGRRVARQLGGPSGLADFDLAAQLVRKPEDEWPTLSPDGRVWAVLDRDAPLTFYDAKTGDEISRSRRATTAGDTGPRVFSRDGRRFAAERTRGVAGVWDVGSGAVQQELKSHTGDIGALAFSPDGRLLASAGGHGELVLWDVDTGRWLSRQLGWEEGVVSMDLLQHAGRLLLAATDTTSLGLFEVPSLQPLTRVRRGEMGLGISALGASPDGTLLAVGRLDETVHLLDVAALLAQPEAMVDDPVRVVTTAPPTEQDDRRAAEAFRALAQARLDAQSAGLDQELRAIVARLPEGTTRVTFYYDRLMLTEGESVSWEAVPAAGPERATQPVELFAEPLLPAETLDDPQYQSAAAEPQEVLDELFIAWIARHWQRAAPPHLEGVLSPAEGFGQEYDLHTGRPAVDW